MTEPRTTVELLRQVAAEYTDTDAFVTATGERLSFGEWDRAADGIAAGLADRGVGPGDVVCLLMPSSPEYMVCYQAIMRLGAITSGINPRLGRDEVAHILDRCEPRLTIVGDGDDRGLAWLELREAWDADAPPLPAIDANQPTLICWTGGTTGRPRGAVFDHENLKAVAAATGVLSARFDRRLSPIPFAHVGTMTRAWDEISKVITTVITPTPWDAGENLRLIERERVTVGQGVPTQWELMLRHPD
ncbi:MAG: acyl--CoA ligase, partial [Acidimicrobiia bacterium]|nr:acyl--CoA ligase [Acidimicrobiia bacterium]